MSEPVAWIQSNHLQLARQGVHLVRTAPTQHQSDYIPLYTADAIREAVEAETKELIRILKLIEAQDQGCGGTATEAEAWRAAKQIAFSALRARGAA